MIWDIIQADLVTAFGPMFTAWAVAFIAVDILGTIGVVWLAVLYRSWKT